uniref:IP19862p n=1 Tax=Drosophila melanogaster TaxID=7227 RepID=Q9VWE5_DROME|nr:uncharacterized protein Dmel_CG14223, isoform B [Drosophila melanogaster]NP_001259724.1 uncharacterized protein Dmel_CG14223, isoform C [Drosophila melanogaster]NP_608341.1 uncharacterized protein Dmel_CG14223, isoform A [Drosophila melanogaster]AAF48997.1 uncharacterized protein Dmel_CG14223, isoform A [Drosophila melanogaster]ACU32634.1 IP20162p [Drosophila melanogaster]ACX32986.1 IP19862p [Drosophila melanogaster]AGB95563.1 uncharacterized protein Dmel_CG14223, isoform B [Drosophila mel|eukprot:NP_001259723.1 uncharacterized protein Dmel_CG14223, isoform B [Drosophila melanogaster]
MLKHASTTSSTAATSATSAAVAINPLSTLLVNSCNSNPNSNSSSSNNHTGGSGSGHNTPPTVEAEASIGIGIGVATTATTAGTAGTTNGNGGSPTPAAAAVASTARNIHLRPPQPLNISALNASVSSTLLNEGTGAMGGGVAGGVGAGRGCVGNANSTLLNIATPSTPLKPLTPLTQLTPNGHFLGNGSVHHHTYTNQHILASHQQQQQQHQHHHQQQQHHNHHNHHHQHQQTNHAQAQSQTHNLSQLPQNYRNFSHPSTNPVRHKLPKSGPSPREALTSLGLLCLISLLLALLSLIFLLRISPNGREDAVGRGAGGEDFIVVYDVTLALGALSLSLNLCCLLVCAIQFLFAVKLREPAFEGRDNQYLVKSSASRTCAVSGFFISIPVFLTGLILYTFSHFHSTPAIVTSLLIGVGIVFCGGAMVHNVFVWQREKTISYRGAPLSHNLSVISAGQLPATLPVSMPLPPGPFHTYQAAHQGHQSHLVPPSVTAVSPNHSHGSFNPLLLGGGGGGGGALGAVNSSFLVRPATATPPTPTPRTLANSSCLTAGREASGSVSPGIPPTLDMSNITVLLHELSTLV